MEESGSICTGGGNGDGGDDPGILPGGPGGGSDSSPWDGDGDGVMECWRSVTLNPSIPPATGPYGNLADRFHYGTDITSGAGSYGKGSPILAVARGTVVVAQYTAANGNYVKINHDDGRASYYLHLLAIDHMATVGSRVIPGQMIGTMNCTGNCFSGGVRGVDRGTHLHLEIRTSHTAGRVADGSTTIDPTTYLGTCP